MASEGRPTEEGAKKIYEIYLRETLPLGESQHDLVEGIVKAQYAHTAENAFLEVVYRSGKKNVLYRGDMSSGAIIAAVVERAKGLAIKRAIDTHADTTLTRDDLLNALQQEYAENDLFPATDITEDWLKLTDFDPDNVIKLGPVKPRKADAFPSRIV